MKRFGLVLSGAAVVVAALGCGPRSDDSAAAPVPNSSTVNAAIGGSTAVLFTTESGLACRQDLFEVTNHEAGFADPAGGFTDIGAAAADYWKGGDGRYRDDRDQLTEIVDPPTVRYDNEQGETQLILSFVQTDDAWRLDYSEACSDAPVGTAGQALADVLDQAGAVVSARLLVPDELPSYDSLRVELDERRVVVMQPGDLGFDAVIVFRSTPQCGNLPEVVVDGDTSSLHVSIRTPVSGDCDPIDYDRVIGIDLAPEFEQTPIVVA